MIRRPPRSTRTDTLFPYTTLFRSGVLLADAAQSAGKLPLPDADMVAVSAHKLGGPPGIGALILKDERLIEAAGGQERGLRGGTENLPAIMGFAAARSEERRVGKECVRTCRSWWSAGH